MSENTPSHAASHLRLRRTKQAIVLAVAGGTAAVWALVATNSVGVTATAAADSQTNANQVAPPQVVPGPQGQDDGGFFGAPNDQPGFFGGDGFRQRNGSSGGGTFGGSGNGFGQNGSNGQSGSGSSGSGTFGGGFGQGGFGGGVGPMMQSGGS